jgi:tetraacyldisaccharide 4'-kinase
MLRYYSSRVYGCVSAFRNYAYDRGLIRQERCRLPIICVGNIHAGGSGKTPLIIHLIDFLQSEGRKPVVLTRGYGGSYKDLHQVRASDDAEVCGDEPLLIFHKTGVPVVCCRDRVRGAGYIEGEELGDVILLDDGFQHRRLIRDFNILAMSLENDSAFRSFSDDLLLPYGELREARDPALLRADALLLLKRSVNVTTEKIFGERVGRVKEIVGDSVPIFEAFLDTQELVNDLGEIVPRGGVHALCAIAHPEAFFETLEFLGFQVFSKTALRDHAKISSRLIKKLKEQKDIPIVCTEKDLMRVSKDLRAYLASLPIELNIHEEGAFFRLLSRKIRN